VRDLFKNDVVLMVGGGHGFQIKEDYENGVPNIMQNRGDYAIVKQVPLQPSPLWGENVGKFFSTWIFGSSKFVVGLGLGHGSWSPSVRTKLPYSSLSVNY